MKNFKKNYSRLRNLLRYVSFMTKNLKAAVKAGIVVGAEDGLTDEVIDWATRLCCETRTTYYHILDLLGERGTTKLRKVEQTRVTRVFAAANAALKPFKQNQEIQDLYEAVHDRWDKLVHPMKLRAAVLHLQQ